MPIPCSRNAGGSSRRKAQNSPPSGSAMTVQAKPVSSAGWSTVAPRPTSSSMLATYTSRWTRCLTVLTSGTGHIAIDW